VPGLVHNNKAMHKLAVIKEGISMGKDNNM
jgi:hypothetical protein